MSTVALQNMFPIGILAKSGCPPAMNGKISVLPKSLQPSVMFYE